MKYKSSKETNPSEKATNIQCAFLPLIGYKADPNSGHITEVDLDGIIRAMGNVKKMADGMKMPDEVPDSPASHIAQRVDSLVNTFNSLKKFKASKDPVNYEKNYMDFVESFNAAMAPKDGKSFQQDVMDLMISSNFKYSNDSPEITALNHCLEACHNAEVWDFKLELAQANEKLQSEKGIYERNLKEFNGNVEHLKTIYDDTPTPFFDMYKKRNDYTQTMADMQTLAESTASDAEIAEDLKQEEKDSINGTINSYKGADKKDLVGSLELWSDTNNCNAISKEAGDYYGRKDDHRINNLTANQMLERDVDDFITQEPEMRQLQAELKEYNRLGTEYEAHKDQWREADDAMKAFMEEHPGLEVNYKDYMAGLNSSRLNQPGREEELAGWKAKWQKFISDNKFEDFQAQMDKKYELDGQIIMDQKLINMETNRLGGKEYVDQKSARLSQLEQNHTPQREKALLERVNKMQDDLHVKRTEKLQRPSEIASERKEQIRQQEKAINADTKRNDLHQTAKKLVERYTKLEQITPESVGMQRQMAKELAPTVARDLDAYEIPMRPFDACLKNHGEKVVPSLRAAESTAQEITMNFRSDGFRKAQEELREIAAHINDNKRPLHRNTAEFTKMADGLKAVQEVLNGDANVTAEAKMQLLTDLRQAAVEYTGKKMESGRAANASSMRNTRLFMASNIYRICDTAIQSMETEKAVSGAQNFLSDSSHKEVAEMSVEKICDKINPSCRSLKADSDTVKRYQEIAEAKKKAAAEKREANKNKAAQKTQNKPRRQRSRDGSGMGFGGKG